MEVRLDTTENEKLVQTALGLDSEYKNFNMQEQSIDNLIAKEKARKFNNEVEKYNAQLDKNNKECQEAQETLQYDINLAEIKPMLARILVKPFKQDIKFVTNMIMKKKLKILNGTSPKAKIDAFPRR